jgi:hypothetical protein
MSLTGSGFGGFEGCVPVPVGGKGGGSFCSEAGVAADEVSQDWGGDLSEELVEGRSPAGLSDTQAPESVA